jgi:D-alanyl-D-alanine carboxypeptidase (penicillin-binding protein 5/6)
MGERQSVGLVPAEDVTALLPVLAGSSLQGEVLFKGPVEAPVEAGQPLGELVFTPEGLPEVRVPLVAESAVARGGFMVRIGTAAQMLLTRFANGRPETTM